MELTYVMLHDDLVVNFNRFLVFTNLGPFAHLPVSVSQGKESSTDSFPDFRYTFDVFYSLKCR